MSLSEVQERVLQLESAIKRLDIVKKHLNRNASDVSYYHIICLRCKLWHIFYRLRCGYFDGFLVSFYHVCSGIPHLKQKNGHLISYVCLEKK